MDERLDQIAKCFLARSHASEFRPASIGAKLLPYLFVLDIERDSAKEVSGLRIRLTGTAFDRAFGKPLKGHTLEEFIHGPRASEVIGGFHHCANTREPVWMRQFVQLKGRPPRSVEGVAIYLQPERIYGGLIIGEAVNCAAYESFERRILRTSVPQP